MNQRTTKYIRRVDIDTTQIQFHREKDFYLFYLWKFQIRIESMFTQIPLIDFDRFLNGREEVALEIGDAC